MPVLGTGSGRYIRRPLLAIKAPIRALQLPQEQQATGPRWTLSLPQTIILNCHKKKYCTIILYERLQMEGKFALVCDILGRQGFADLRDKFYGQQFLAAEKTLTWSHPQGHLFLPPFVQIFQNSQTDLKTGLQMFPSSFAAQTWPSMECKAEHIWGPTNCFCRAFLGCGVCGIGIAVLRKWFHGLRIWILC